MNTRMSIHAQTALAITVIVAAFRLSAGARTIELTAAAIDRVAVLSEEGPRQSWAAYAVSPGVFSNARFDLNNERTALVRYNLDVIPSNQRITHAEWIIPIDFNRPAGSSRLYVWRILPEWGPGVSYLHRLTVPDGPENWALPGARGNSSDRATRPTAIVRPPPAGEAIVNVTQDVELWYRGSASNHGWMLSIEDPGVDMRLPVPLVPDRFRWILRITYEPQH